METKFIDVVISKEYLAKIGNKLETKKSWNKVGKAWISKSGDALNVELFLFPNQRFVVNFKDKFSNNQSQIPMIGENHDQSI